MGFVRVGWPDAWEASFGALVDLLDAEPVGPGA